MTFQQFDFSMHGCNHIFLLFNDTFIFVYNLKIKISPTRIIEGFIFKFVTHIAYEYIVK